MNATQGQVKYQFSHTPSSNTCGRKGCQDCMLAIDNKYATMQPLKHVRGVNPFCYMDKGNLLGTKTLVVLIRHYIRDMNGLHLHLHLHLHFNNLAKG